jgi:hypothetical protein
MQTVPSCYKQKKRPSGALFKWLEIVYPLRLAA